MTVQPDDPREVIKALLVGAVPERRADIERLWRKYNPRVEVCDNARGITLKATREKIEFDLKTADVFWLIGFGGWRAIECYSPLVLLSFKRNQQIEALIRDHGHLPEIERDYRERRAAVHSLLDATSASDIKWPPDLPRPSASRDAIDQSQYKTTFDLTLLALALALFHEFRHVMLDIDEKRPPDRREEEMACDVWAREFMTANAGAYAEAHLHSYQQVLQKRSMGFALAALVLHDITPVWDHGGNAEYFSLADRLTAILGNTALPDQDHFWVFTASLLLGVFRQRGTPVNVPAMSPRNLSECLIARL